MVTLYGEDDEALATARLRFDSGTGVLVLTDIDDPSALLRYFFGRGRSRVSLLVAGEGRSARLSTHWQGGHRIWFARVEREQTDRTDLPSTASAGAVTGDRSQGLHQETAFHSARRQRLSSGR